MGFSMVYLMLQAGYTTAEKEFRTIVFLFFMARADTQKFAEVTKDETT